MFEADREMQREVVIEQHPHAACRGEGGEIREGKVESGELIVATALLTSELALYLRRLILKFPVSLKVHRDRRYPFTGH